MFVAVVSAPVSASAIDCSFDTNGDGTPELVLGDADDDDLCDWPSGTTTLPGTLTFDADSPVEFHGSTLVVANRIVVEDGARLVGDRETLAKLVLRAATRSTSDIVVHGTLDIDASDDIIFEAIGSVSIDGPTDLRAGDRLVLKASTGNVELVPAASNPNDFDLFARNRIEIGAKGANASIDIAGARIGSFRIIVRTKANVSIVGDKQLTVRDHSELTTDVSKTELSNSSNIQLDATGRIVLTESSVIDAGTNITVRTQRTTDDVCLSQGVTLEAGNGFGRLYFTGVHGTVFDDGTTIFAGAILGDPIVVGTCP